jgi:septin family protein
MNWILPIGIIVTIVLSIKLVAYWRRAWSHQRHIRDCMVVTGSKQTTDSTNSNNNNQENTKLRIQVVGAAGSGKSTIATELSKAYQLTYVRLDNFKSILPKWKNKDRIAFEKVTIVVHPFSYDTANVIHTPTQ